VKDPEWKNWSTFSGRPASVKAEANCSTIVGVWGEGFRITAFPARMAGIKLLTRVR
jgi:hypothetical protein